MITISVKLLIIVIYFIVMVIIGIVGNKKADAGSMGVGCLPYIILWLILTIVFCLIMWILK